MMRREDCYINVTGIDTSALLQDWRWLIGPDDLVLFQATGIGDLFLKNASGHVFFLDAKEGEFTQIASSEQDLLEKLKARENRERWLRPTFIQLAGFGRPPLKPGQCWGWKIPPFLGGKIATENAEPSDLLAYHSILGQLYRQARGQ
jgi:hypothetical protein